VVAGDDDQVVREHWRTRSVVLTAGHHIAESRPRTPEEILDVDEVEATEKVGIRVHTRNDITRIL
jgi:hypothetical protein